MLKLLLQEKCSKHFTHLSRKSRIRTKNSNPVKSSDSASVVFRSSFQGASNVRKNLFDKEEVEAEKILELVEVDEDKTEDDNMEEDVDDDSSVSDSLSPPSSMSTDSPPSTASSWCEGSDEEDNIRVEAQEPDKDWIRKIKSCR